MDLEEKVKRLEEKLQKLNKEKETFEGKCNITSKGEKELEKKRLYHGLNAWV